MIKAVSDSLLIFGLSDENIRRLQKGEPIKFALNELGIKGDYEVIIFNGKDEQTMQTMMKPLIHPYKTVIKDERGAKSN